MIWYYSPLTFQKCDNDTSHKANDVYNLTQTTLTLQNDTKYINIKS